MKKILTLVCCTILLAATSCTKKYVTPGAKTIFTNANNWVADNSLHTLSADVSVPDLNSYYDDNGAVLVYFKNSDGEYVQLPNVFNSISLRTTYTTNGHVFIDAQNVNGTIPSINQVDNLDLKIVLVP